MTRASFLENHHRILIINNKSSFYKSFRKSNLVHENVVRTLEPFMKHLANILKTVRNKCKHCKNTNANQHISAVMPKRGLKATKRIKVKMLCILLASIFRQNMHKRIYMEREGKAQKKKSVAYPRITDSIPWGCKVYTEAVHLESRYTASHVPAAPDVYKRICTRVYNTQRWKRKWCD